MLALVISALMSLGIIDAPADYESGMFYQYESQIEQELQMDITNTEIGGL